MNLQQRTFIFLLLFTLSLGPLPTVALPQNNSPEHSDNGFSTKERIKHVLLISVDGLHAIDLAKYTKAHPDSTLAELSEEGVTYTNASSAKPSDSFPGLLAILTGGSPNSTGVWYDDSYDRALSPPGSNCATVGTEVVYDESIDKNPDDINAGGGIDPSKLPLDPKKGCTPVYPHSYLRVNTIFEVIKHKGGRTAWADKHPAYDLVNGPSGQGVDDLYTPEIAAGGTTGSIALTEAYDDLKVAAVINEINGKDHTGTTRVGVPRILGMNFQAVSVGQKLKGNGYLDGDGTPSAGLLDALDHTDQSLGKMVNRLKARNLFDSTLIIITAKHGQSPIEPLKLNKISKDKVSSVVDGVGSDLLAQITADDIALLWLTDQKRTGDVVNAFRSNLTALAIEKIYSGDSLKLLFNNPQRDSRVPDIILQPNLGVIYTGSSKIAEHGGFSVDDTNVALLVSFDETRKKVIKSAVETTQIAPTILAALGINPQTLEAVRKEKTTPLPGLRFIDLDEE